MTDSKKIEEGLEYIKAAEKSLKTTLLKWRPDYDVAADEYTKAATCFRLAKYYEQSKDCHLKAADCHKHNRSLFHAAKSLEQAVLVCKELNDLRSIPELAERACIWYQQQGSPDAAASALDKAAKIIEQQQPNVALKLFQQAADVVSLDDNVRQGAEYVSKTARILVKLKMYDQAADAIRREIGLHQQSENLPAIGRLAVALVLVQLARGDAVAAEKAFKEWGNCCDAPEVQTLEMLLQAYDEEDPEGAKRALNSSFIKHMDVEYARLARDLPLPEITVVGPPPAAVRPNAAPSYVSPRASAEDPPPPIDKGSCTSAPHEDDEEELDLC